MLLVCSLASAQNISDVLRYSSENLQGTARFQAMGGAFGALGGDLSALNVNPAGSAVFNNNMGTVTGTYTDRNNTITFGGSVTGDTPNYLDINQAGGVLVFKSSDPQSDWTKVALAINYDITQNFDNAINIQGNSTEGIDNYFLDFAQGVPFGDIQLRDGEFIEDAYLDIGASQGFGDQQAFLGYFGGLIDPSTMDADNTDYISNASYTSVNHNLNRITSGYNSRFTANIATQYKERIHFGASLNFNSILYDRYDEYTESNYSADSEIQRTTFDNRLFTQGAGFSISVGTIAKLNDFIRIGANYQSPTWYRLQDELSQRISSDLADDNINFINLDQVNIFPRYKLKTPAKVTGSLALIFGKNGLLSLDYGYQDMSKAELGPTSDPNFASVNTDVANELGAVSSFRLGGEYRIERFSLRAGYRFEESPYENSDTLGDLEGISGGIGYNFGSSRLDLAINRTERNAEQRLFDTGINTPALINGISTNGTLSYTINF